MPVIPLGANRKCFVVSIVIIYPIPGFYLRRRVAADRKLTQWGMRTKTWTGYAARPRLSRSSMGLRAPREILIRFSLYHRMYESRA